MLQSANCCMAAWAKVYTSDTVKDVLKQRPVSKWAITLVGALRACPASTAHGEKKHSNARQDCDLFSTSVPIGFVVSFGVAGSKAFA